MHLEQLEQGRELGLRDVARAGRGGRPRCSTSSSRAATSSCARSERQKHFYLGQLAALGRITPTTYDGDPDFDGLLAVVPFGLGSATPPVHERDVLKGVRPGFGVDDKVLLWSGGLYNWFDPMTLIRAVAAVARARGVRLFFQGTKHPHPGVPEMRDRLGVAARSRASWRARQAVFFNDSGSTTPTARTTCSRPTRA